MLTRRHFLRSTVLVGGAILASCAPAPTSAPAAQPTTAATTTAPTSAPAAQPTTVSTAAAAVPAGQTITLKMHTRQGADHAGWELTRIPLFEQQHPGIKVEQDQINGAEMFTKLYAMAASKTIGDLCWTYSNSMIEHVKKGVPRAIEDIVQAKNFDMSGYWPGIIDSFTKQGHLYALPFTGHFGTVVFYYNVDLWKEKAGSAEPTPDWTTDMLVEAGKKMTAAPDTWGYRAVAAGDEFMPFYLRTFGGDTMNQEGTKALFTDPKSMAGLKWLYDLKNTFKVDPCVCGDNTYNNFIAGKVGCYNWTTGYASQFVQVKDLKVKWNAMVAPKGPDGNRGNQASGAGYCVTANSKYPNEAFDLAAFWATKEDGIGRVLWGAGSPGARFDEWESPELAAYHPIYGIIMKTFPEGPGKWLFPANGRVTEFATTRDNDLQAIWTGKIGFEEGVAALQKDCQDVLDKEPA